MDFSLFHMWQQMGVVAKTVVAILLVMSIYAIGMVVERWLTFRKGRRQSLGYVGAIQQLIANQAPLSDLVGVDRRWKGSPIARVIGFGIDEFARGVGELGPRARDRDEVELVVDDVIRAMNRVKEREVVNLKKGLATLATISSSAPFVGLFGTVFGIITAFQNMADPKGGGGGLATVSAGISEALLTTAVGLAVAIVSVWFYNYFINRVDDVTVDVDETAGEIVDRMMREARRSGASA
ncbi:MAG TPA: MotA/TolQ/ExbB proton channel family protein [Polyangia bacterium]|jgi:biopolymer transport protein ExbB|nr:MotA/TolQ/ExbB proton channel family protein [Polyangia bacterium]